MNIPADVKRFHSPLGQRLTSLSRGGWQSISSWKVFFILAVLAALLGAGWWPNGGL